MQIYWEVYQLIFEWKKGLKLNLNESYVALIKGKGPFFYNTTTNIKNLISDSIIVILNIYLADKL